MYTYVFISSVCFRINPKRKSFLYSKAPGENSSGANFLFLNIRALDLPSGRYAVYVVPETALCRGLRFGIEVECSLGDLFVA